jgi:hypothetical protein
MKLLDVFWTKGVDVGADRLSCVIAMHVSGRPIGSATTAASVVSPLSTPPVGTPGAVAHGGNSTPARPLVAGAGKSPGFGPVSGE